MRYAPIGGGLDPDFTPIEPRIGSIGTRPEVWELACRAAERFWLSVQKEEDTGLARHLTPDMRQLAVLNLEVARAFAAPLVAG